MNYIKVKDQLPEENKEVMTCIIEDSDIRMEQTLKLKDGIWWFPDESFYVYYTPTHWREIN